MSTSNARKLAEAASTMETLNSLEISKLCMSGIAGGLQNEWRDLVDVSLVSPAIMQALVAPFYERNGRLVAADLISSLYGSVAASFARIQRLAAENKELRTIAENYKKAAETALRAADLGKRELSLVPSDN